MLKIFSILFLIHIIAFYELITGHGRLLEPVGRSSRWRFDNSAIKNHDDSALYCGGFSTHQDRNGGRCGLCGDNYADARPRRNEYGGLYGEGVIVGRYKKGNSIHVGVQIVANHKGYYGFQICNMDKENESDECFAKYPVKFTSGSDKYYIAPGNGWHNQTIVLPPNLVCKKCVLRWTYVAGNNWGVCDNGTSAVGCGKQEWFRSCSDIAIN